MKSYISSIKKKKNSIKIWYKLFDQLIVAYLNWNFNSIFWKNKKMNFYVKRFSFSINGFELSISTSILFSSTVFKVQARNIWGIFNFYELIQLFLDKGPYITEK